MEMKLVVYCFSVVSTGWTWIHISATSLWLHWPDNLLQWLLLYCCRLPWQPLHCDVTVSGALPDVCHASAAAAASQTSHSLYTDTDLRAREKLQTSALPVRTGARAPRIRRRTFTDTGTTLDRTRYSVRPPLCIYL